MATGSYLTPIYSRSQSEVQGDLHTVLKKLGHYATETFAKLQQAYIDSVLSRAQVFRWFKAFSEGRESIEDEPRSGRPSVSKTAEYVIRVRDILRSDRRLTVKMIGEELNLNRTTVHQILTNELKMRKICAKMVPKNLSQ
ncbi:protein GVQW3 [Trichonephila clavipes]|nr:protein GVQW3 [Trichonephila clavipes]